MSALDIELRIYIYDTFHAATAGRRILFKSNPSLVLEYFIGFIEKENKP